MFHVRAVLCARTRKMAGFDQKKLQPYVIFYQQCPTAASCPISASARVRSTTRSCSGATKLKEPFGVDYVMPVPGTPGPNNTTQGEYYGFVIGIYYDKVLQDVRSEPSDLSSRMALPREIE